MSNTKRNNERFLETQHAIKHGSIYHYHELLGKPIIEQEDSFDYHKEYSKSFPKGSSKELYDYRQTLAALGVTWKEIEEKGKISYDHEKGSIVYSDKVIRFEVDNKTETKVVSHYSAHCIDSRHYDLKTGTDKRDGLKVACQPNPIFLGKCPCSSCSSFNVRFKKQEARKERHNKLKEADFGF